MSGLLQGRPRLKSGARRPSFLLSVAAATWLLSTLVVATPQPRTVPQEQQAKVEDPDTGLFHRLCDECHTSAQIVSRRRTRAEWEDVITKMLEKGLDGPEKELEAVFAFLNRNYGKVFINRAPADELVAVLTITQQDADAIVAFRKTAGSFADLDAVKKVPGIDLKKIEERKDAIAF